MEVEYLAGCIASGRASSLPRIREKGKGMKWRGITPGGALMAFVAASFLVFCAATRWGLDLYGPWLAHFFGWTK